MKQPVLQYLNGPSIPLMEAPNDALQAILAGDINWVRDTALAHPEIISAIAARILCERAA